MWQIVKYQISISVFNVYIYKQEIIIHWDKKEKKIIFGVVFILAAHFNFSYFMLCNIYRHPKIIYYNNW